MLGSSSSKFDKCIQQVVALTGAKRILEFGCGQGKFGKLINVHESLISLRAVQKVFQAEDVKSLNTIGYEEIIDADIMEYFRVGFDETYDLTVEIIMN